MKVWRNITIPLALLAAWTLLLALIPDMGRIADEYQIPLLRGMFDESYVGRLLTVYLLYTTLALGPLLVIGAATLFDRYRRRRERLNCAGKAPVSAA
jgi:hypothetical protein